MTTVTTVFPDPDTGSVVTIDGKSHTVAQTELINLSGSANAVTTTQTLDATNWVAFKITTPSNATSLSWITAVASLTASGNSGDTLTSKTVEYDVYSDSAGLPNVAVWSSYNIVGAGVKTTGTATPLELPWNGTWHPANTTSYWLVIKMAGTLAGTYAVGYDNASGANIIATTSNSGGTWGTIAGTGVYSLGNGGGHALIGNSIVTRAVSGTTLNGSAIYGEGQGTKAYAGYFLAGPGSAGIFIDATNAAAGRGFEVQGIGGGYMQVDQSGSLVAGGGYIQNIVKKTANYALTLKDGTVLADAASKTMTLPDPSASGQSGRIYIIKNTENGTSTTVATTAGQIEVAGVLGATDTLSAAGDGAHYQAFSTKWYRVATV